MVLESDSGNRKESASVHLPSRFDERCFINGSTESLFGPRKGLAAVMDAGGLRCTS